MAEKTGKKSVLYQAGWVRGIRCPNPRCGYKTLYRDKFGKVFCRSCGFVVEEGKIGDLRKAKKTLEEMMGEPKARVRPRPEPREVRKPKRVVRKPRPVGMPKPEKMLHRKKFLDIQVAGYVDEELLKQLQQLQMRTKIRKRRNGGD